MPYKHDDKSSGQLIRSADWNTMGHEIERLEADKVNRAGDIIKGDLTVTGKAQLGPLTITGDASVSGNVGIGTTSRPSERLEVTGNLKVTGERIKSADGFGIVQTNAKDWLRINPDSHYPSIALYNPVAIGAGGLSIGDWSQMPQGQLKVTGQAQLGSLAVTGDATVGNLKVMGERIKSADGFGIVQTNAKDWLRINPDSHYPSIALYNPVAIGNGGLAIGDWSQMPQGQLKVTGQAQFGSVTWGNGSTLTPDQGGSIELGGNNSTKGVGVPYIDFHFSGLAQDYNTRIINDADGRLSVNGNLRVTGSISCGGDSVVNGVFVVNSPVGNKLIMQGDGNLVIYRSNGTAWWNSQTNVSDSRLKKDIRSIERPLEKLLSFSGISFCWAEEEWGSERELGVLADEVEKVFPELICSLDKKYKSVKYQGLIAVLIEAIKEQQATILQFGEEIQIFKDMLKPNPA